MNAAIIIFIFSISILILVKTYYSCICIEGLQTKTNLSPVHSTEHTPVYSPDQASNQKTKHEPEHAPNVTVICRNKLNKKQHYISQGSPFYTPPLKALTQLHG